MWPYLKTRGVKSEGIRAYALGYLVGLVVLVVFWFWWVSQPLPGADPAYAIPNFIVRPTIEVYPGFYSVFVTPSPVP